MNLRGLFQEFNASKFVVYLTVLIFTFLLGLKLDHHITCSIWIIFIPIWIWEFMAIFGACVGTFICVKHPEYRHDANVDIHAMLIATVFHIILLVFELLLCLKLQYDSVSYRLVFVPIYVMSTMSIVACFWSFRHDRSVELETFFSVNILQFICISLKLDKVINWSWPVVFIPMWIVLSLLCVIVLYYAIWAALILRSLDLPAPQRKTHVVYAIVSALIVLPLLSFFILLSQRLEEKSDHTYLTVLAPLQLALFGLIVTTFYQKSGNHWWFGLRKDFCEFSLDLCPCLKEYGNIAYSFDHESEDEDTAEMIYVSHGKSSRLDGSFRATGTKYNLEVPD